MELEVGSGDFGTSPQLARLLTTTAWSSRLANQVTANPSPCAMCPRTLKVPEGGGGEVVQIPTVFYIHVANDVVSFIKIDSRQYSEHIVVF